jgi:N-acetylmuramoyl-L-alanine amidase
MKKIRAMILAAAMIFGMSVFTIANVSAGTYTTVSGDTLYKIGQTFGTTASEIMKSNNLSSSMIGIGQKLYVDCDTYTVKSGDTLFSISKKYGVTLTALRKANNIYTDIIYIGQVLNIPGTVPAPQTPPAPAYAASDVDLLARLIMAEAESESYGAKVAVGAVVLNRVESSQWPNTISGVIYQNINGYYQFSPVANGTINRPANEESIRAAKAAMSGYDPTNGAMFYYDTSTKNQWMLSKPVSARIDNMVFAY